MEFEARVLRAFDCVVDRQMQIFGFLGDVPVARVSERVESGSSVIDNGDFAVGCLSVNCCQMGPNTGFCVGDRVTLQ